MTEAQAKRFYFPAWNECARANGWENPKLETRNSKQARKPEARSFDQIVRALEAEVREGRDGRAAWPEPARGVMLQVLTLAEQLAKQQARGITVEDMRHACNLAATDGKEASSRALDNRQTNRVVCLFRLLREPDDLDAVMDWQDPHRAERRSLISFIRKQAPEGTLCAIYRNAYGTIYWEEGNEQQLVWLLKQVKGRKKNFQASIINSQGSFKGQKVEEPF